MNGKLETGIFTPDPNKYEKRREEEEAARKRKEFYAAHDNDDTLKPWDPQSRDTSNASLHFHLFVIGVIIGVIIWLAIAS